MSFRSAAKGPLGSAAALTLLLMPVSALGASRATATAHAAGSVLRSRELWATINVCNPKDQPDYVGIRGQMPGDGRPHDALYMSFRMQKLDSATKHWNDVAGTTTPFLRAGAGVGRQIGASFQIKPEPGRPAMTFRGLVEFQWRRGKTVLESTRRPTTAGHVSLAGADPAGFSAAMCQIG
jgi:hypothetical protein